jgi:Ran GTPase-activating protein (RanGAP) involved in mRNA processing and transport
VNLDGFALPVKKLKGTDPVETLDLSGKNLGVASSVVIASLISVNGGLTGLDLSSNQLCGLDYRDRGTYTAEGITAIADALRVNGALTKLSLAQNQLKEEGTKAVCEALEQNTTLKELDISGIGYGNRNIGRTVGVKHVAKMLGVNGALTVVNLLGNHLDLESAKMLVQVAKQKGISLCGIRRDQTTADFSNKYLEPPDAILLASDLSQAVVTGSLTQVPHSAPPKLPFLLL